MFALTGELAAPAKKAVIAKDYRSGQLCSY